ncbi:hypothetical protein [Streptomyces zhaozhouensis]|uniref:hypothetical protein n=1 Tax=Streptomyces zhaozhouensis TaxID=1300267 RepID=UPI001144C71A|nr:hypothetical protein [Streptomyces zhaozhouensis]
MEMEVGEAFGGLVVGGGEAEEGAGGGAGVKVMGGVVEDVVRLAGARGVGGGERVVGGEDADADAGGAGFVAPAGQRGGGRPEM